MGIFNKIQNDEYAINNGQKSCDSVPLRTTVETVYWKSFDGQW
jgi:hypothetical protein